MTDQQDSADNQAEQQAMPELPESELPGAIIAMLFAATEPTRLQLLGRTTGYETRTIRRTLDEIAPDIARLGLILQWTDQEHVQLATNPDLSPLIRRFLGIERTTKLSAAALEVLAVIGYRQPVTRPEIDSVRGVDSSGVLQTLVARELIEPVGRLSGPGTPVQYGTTGEFLRLFGLTSRDELPELPDELVEQLEADESPDEQPS
jgi:segregation and condensation protein B